MFLERISCAVLAVAAAGSSAHAAEVLPGPYQGAVERVVDGDTLAVRVNVWIGQDLQVLVRLRGIDAPEIRGRCLSERARAQAATARLAKLVAGGTVELRQIEGDKYFGRVLADVSTPADKNVAERLIAAGSVRPYSGDTRQSWCAEPEATGSIGKVRDGQ